MSALGSTGTGSLGTLAGTIGNYGSLSPTDQASSLSQLLAGYYSKSGQSTSGTGYQVDASGNVYLGGSPASTGTPSSSAGTNPITAGTNVGNQQGNIGSSTPSSLSSLGTALGGGASVGTGSPSSVLQNYANLYAQGLQSVGQYGQTELAQLQNSYLQQSATQQQGLQSRGLGNTTVANSVQTGLSQAQDLASTNLAEQIGQYKTSVLSTLGLPMANAASQIYSQQSSQDAAMQQQVAQINAQAALQQQQIAAQIQSNANQFNYATALAAQQYGYSSNLQGQQFGLQNQYQTQLLKLQSQLQNTQSQQSHFGNPLTVPDIGSVFGGK